MNDEHGARVPEEPVSTPRLSRQSVEQTSQITLVFEHQYTPPRGRASLPLAKLPIWFPIAGPLVEHLSLSQVIFRSLASSREPFRRAMLIVDTAERTARSVFDWAFSAASESSGANLTPVWLSYRDLLRHPATLERIANTFRVSLKDSLKETDERRMACVTALRELLGLSIDGSTSYLEEALGRLLHGNAFLILLDDSDSTLCSADAVSTRNSLDTVFDSSSPFSHVPILVFTSSSTASIISDCQTYRQCRDVRGTGDMSQAGELPPISRVRPPSGRLVSVFRAAHWFGSLPPLPSILLPGLLACACLAWIHVHYTAFMQCADGGSCAAFKPLIWIPVALLFAPLMVGNIFGLGWGSEEVRLCATDGLLVSVPMALTSLLLIIPRYIPAGGQRTAAVLVTGLPCSFLLSTMIIAFFVTLANVLWMILSTRMLKAMGPGDLVETCKKYRVEVHTGRQSVCFVLPASKTAPPLPVLLSYRSIDSIRRMVETFPSIIGDVRVLIIRSLKGKRPDGGRGDYPSAALLLDGLGMGRFGPACGQCLRLVAADCLDQWLYRQEYQYDGDLGGIGVNTLEYAARKLCYLTDVEELVAVR
jgi:hypothetical protein